MPANRALADRANRCSVERAVAELKRILVKTWGEGKPLVKLFRTKSSGYLYDSGTNRIFSCKQPEYDLLSNLVALPFAEALDSRLYQCGENDFINALRTIINLIKSKDILRACKAQLIAPNNIDKLMNDSLGHIILEVTEKCNLRCRYCIYNPAFSQKRDHGMRDMSIDIASKAIDYIASHSGSNGRVGISFYGGVPSQRSSDAGGFEAYPCFLPNWIGKGP